VTYQLGVDLGTTFTAAAVYRDGQVAAASLGSRSDAIPSVLVIRQDETMLVGEAAERRALQEPERVGREFKRRIGDTTPLLIGGSPYSAEALTGRLLRWVADEVSAREGGPPRSIVVCHPANWGPYKVELLDQAIQLAGIQGGRRITEPEAAAIHYSRQSRVEVGSLIAVYDLGGGTFDAAVLSKTSGGFDLLGTPKGIERLGGIDFDAAVYGHVSNALGGRLQALDAADPAAVAAVARLRTDCVAAKETLSSDTDVAIPVMLPDLATEVRLTRQEFEAMIRPSLLDSVGALRLAVESAGVAVSDISAVLLVGGSSRIPLVAQLVGAELGRPVNVDTHPKLSIALGAAALGAEASETPSPTGPAAAGGGSTLPPRPGDPPAGPAGPSPGPPPTGSSRSAKALKVGLPVLVVVAVVAALLGFVFGGNEARADEVLLEPVTSVGQDPFTATVTPDPTIDAAIDSAVQAVIDSISPAPGEASSIDFSGVEIPAGNDGEIVNVAGSAPGLYGGTNLIDVCDREQLVEFLTTERDKGEAWADVQGISFEQIPAFVAGLTDVILPVDTRVTNHGYRDGSAYPINSVLQAGTAVLVDGFGVPRVRCFCGNPLLQSKFLADDVTVTGTGWDGFDLDDAVVITSLDPVEEFVIDDIAGPDLLTREPGSQPEAAQIIDRAGETPDQAATTTSTTSTTSTTTTTTTTRPPPTDLTASGSVSASSVYPTGEFGPEMSVDGDLATSWFSAGGGSAGYVWDLLGGRAFVDSITIVGNGGHANQAVRIGFGFEAVRINVLDGTETVWTGDFSLAGTPDPTVTAQPGVAGTQVVLEFTGGEDPTCGGFGELVVMGSIA